MYKHEIHISDVRTFRECRRKWFFASPLSMNLERATPYAPFFLGSAVHSCLQAMYEGKDWQEVLWAFVEGQVAKMGTRLLEIEQNLVDEQSTLAYGILQHYDMWRKLNVNQWSDMNLDVLATETIFTVPVAGSRKIVLSGRFDGIVRRKDTGTYWILENKTARSISELAATLEMDSQANAYCLAARKIYGYAVSGILYNIIRKKIPVSPVQLRDGTLSLNTSIDTTPWWYAACVDEAHPDLTADERKQMYGGIIGHLWANKQDAYFLRVPVRRSDAELSAFEQQFLQTAKEMVKTSTPHYPSDGWHCRYCVFNGPCRLMQTGNVEGLRACIEAEYRRREVWSPEANGFEEASNETNKS